MDKNAPTPASDKDTKDIAAFEARHEEELSTKRFAYTTGMKTFIPLATTAVGAAIGWYTLGKPILKIFPKFFQKTGTLADLVSNAGHITVDQLKATSGKIAEIAPKTLEEIRRLKPDFKLDSLSSLKHFLSNVSPLEMAEVKKTLGIVGEGELKAAQTVGAVTLGIPAMISGGLAVAYPEWRKQESQRLAAEEINRDISRLELFRPSNPELVSENKRLRAMLAAAPAPQVSTVEHLGRATAPETAQQIG